MLMMDDIHAVGPLFSILNNYQVLFLSLSFGSSLQEAGMGDLGSMAGKSTVPIYLYLP